MVAVVLFRSEYSYFQIMWWRMILSLINMCWFCLSYKYVIYQPWLVRSYREKLCPWSSMPMQTSACGLSPYICQTLGKFFFSIQTFWSVNNIQLFVCCFSILSFPKIINSNMFILLAIHIQKNCTYMCPLILILTKAVFFQLLIDRKGNGLHVSTNYNLKRFFNLEYAYGMACACLGRGQNQGLTRSDPTDTLLTHMSNRFFLLPALFIRQTYWLNCWTIIWELMDGFQMSHSFVWIFVYLYDTTIARSRFSTQTSTSLPVLKYFLGSSFR